MSTAPEVRYAELRAKGRTLRGTAIRYGDIAVFPWGRERIERGAFGTVEALDVMLNQQHDRITPLARTGGGGLFLSDGPEALEIRADLPDTGAANDVLELVRKKVLRGLSIEFHAEAERIEDDLRIIEQAALVGVGVVDRGAYPGSTVEARRRLPSPPRIATIKSKVPTGKRLSCECCGRVIEHVEFDLDSIVLGDDAVAAAGNYSKAVASTTKGSLRIDPKAKGGPDVEVDIADTLAGRELLAVAGSVGILVRPYIDQDKAEFIDDGTVRTYTHAPVRAMILGASDAAGGWPEPSIELVDKPEPRGLYHHLRRHRAWL